MTVACCIMFVSSVFVGCFVLTVVAADSSKKDVQPESVPAAADASKLMGPLIKTFNKT